MRTIFFLLLLLITCYFSLVASVNAQTPTCQPIFGGGESCVTTGSLVLDKKLRAPNSDQFVDSTKITDPKFAPDQPVVFQINIKNTGNRVLEDITITDIFPRYVVFVKGPGNFTKDTNTLTFAVDKLEAGQNRAIAIEGKIAPANAIPGTNTVSCVVNQAIAAQGRNRATDNAEFCLQKGAQPQPQSPNQAQPQPNTSPTPATKGGQMPIYEAPNTKTAPRTGPEVFALIGLLPAGAAGILLRRLSK